jgi:hypothetical protein
MNPSPAQRWLPAFAAAGLLGTVVIAGVAMGSGNGDESSGTSEPVASLVTDESRLTAPASTQPVVETVQTSAPVKKTKLDRTLVDGVVGNDVKRVQRRLTELGFWPGPADGVYGSQTIKSVWAYEKLVLGTERSVATGQVTPAMWNKMQDEIVIQPRRPDSTPNHVEIYLPEQVLIIFHDDEPQMITHMSSGTDEEWCEEVTISPGEYGNEDGEEPLVRGECGISLTPGGVFEVYRQVEGVRQSALGGMWDPVYFNYGIAIHGAINVPLQPASHGCIRVSQSISPDMQDLMTNGDQVFVWDGVEEPEFYGAQLPVFNWLDPDYETTTTSTTTTTTTTVPPTTEAPAPTEAPTTQAPATTEAPATTAAPTTEAPVETDPPSNTDAPAAGG